MTLRVLGACSRSTITNAIFPSSWKPAKLPSASAARDPFNTPTAWAEKTATEIRDRERFRGVFCLYLCLFLCFFKRQVRDLRRAVDADGKSGDADPAADEKRRAFRVRSRDVPARQEIHTVDIRRQQPRDGKVRGFGTELDLPAVVMAGENHLDAVRGGRGKDLRPVRQQQAHLARVRFSGGERPREIRLTRAQ